MEVFRSVPAALKGAQFSLIASDTLAQTASIYTGKIHRLDFGGEWWEATLVTPPMTPAAADEVLGWCDLLRQEESVTKLPIPAFPAGTSSASDILLASDVDAGVSFVDFNGIGAGQTITAGTLLTDGFGRLYRVKRTVTGDGSGAASLALFPRLRQAGATGDAFTIVRHQALSGVWYLQERPPQSWAFQRLGSNVEPMTLTFVEAIV